MSVPQSLQRLSEDTNTSQEIRQLLRGSELDGPSEADLARFAARMAPLVGLPVGELAAASLPQGTAPADIGAGSWGHAATQTGVAKVASSFALKAVLAAGALTLGLGLWWANQGPSSQQAVEQAVSRPVLQVPSAAEPVEKAEPVVAVPAEQAMETAPVVAPVVAPKRALQVAAKPDELSLIAQAQGLRDQPQALLKVLKQHATLYPHGMLAQEREVLAVEALVAAGQLDAGKRRAARLEAEYPNSAHLPRIRALLEKAGRE